MADLNVIKNVINLGAQKEFKILHITDTHICRAYQSEGEKLTELAKVRSENCFGKESEIEALFEKAIEYGKENCDLLALTGDIYDFISESAFDYLKENLKNTDYIYAAGNHDFCTAPGADKEDDEFKERQIKKVAPVFNRNLIFDARIVNGVNLITMDDSYYQFSEIQERLLKEEVNKGLPVIIFMHVPLYTPKNAEERMQEGECAYVVAPTEDLRRRYPKERADYQMATKQTMKVVEYIKNEHLIKAVFCGHTHENFEEEISEGKIQYITGGTFKGDIREIIIK